MKKRFVTLCAVAAVVALHLGTIRGDDSPPAVERQEALTVGHRLPDFASTDDGGQLWKSADYLGHKVVVFYFYPGDFTGGCIKQAQAFREGLKSLKDLNVEVVGVSGDLAATHQLFKQSHGLRHTLLADPEGALAMQLGIPVRRAEKPAMVRAVDLDRKPLVDEQGKPIVVERKVTFPRWTMIVDRQGKLVSKRTQINPATDAVEVQKIVESLSIQASGGSRADDLTK